MKADETKTFFLTLLGRADITVDQPTLSLATISAARMWAAFKQFAFTPLDCQQQGFIFESGISPSQDEEQYFYMVFRRYFFLPFDDDPDALFQLCFEASVRYPPDTSFQAWSRWFQVEVDQSLTAAVEAFIAQVEQQRELWQLVTAHEPIDAFIFQ